MHHISHDAIAHVINKSIQASIKSIIKYQKINPQMHTHALHTKNQCTNNMNTQSEKKLRPHKSKACMNNKLYFTYSIITIQCI